MGTAVDADRVAEAAHRVVAEHDPRSVPFPSFSQPASTPVCRGCTSPRESADSASPAVCRRVSDRVLQDAGGPVPLGLNPMGYGMAAPTLREHAQSDDVRRKLLRRLATTEDIWCQLFSEPGAGSDLAGLATSAVPDGDELDRQRPEGVDEPGAPGTVGRCCWPAPIRTCPSTAG